MQEFSEMKNTFLLFLMLFLFVVGEIFLKKCTWDLRMLFVNCGVHGDICLEVLVWKYLFMIGIILECKVHSISGSLFFT
jgi:hypothetical protein